MLMGTWASDQSPAPCIYVHSPAHPARLWGQLVLGCSGQGHPKDKGKQLGTVGPAPKHSKESPDGLHAPAPAQPQRYSHGHPSPLHRPWGQEAPLVLEILCHPGADEMAPLAPPHFPFPMLQLRISVGIPAVPASSTAVPCPHPSCAMGTLPKVRDKATFSPLTVATLGAWGQSSRNSAGHSHHSSCQEWDGLPGSSTYRLARFTGRSHITLGTHRVSAIPSPQPHPQALFLPHLLAPWPGGSRYSLVQREDTQRLAVPGDTCLCHSHPTVLWVPTLTSLPDGPGRPGAPVSPWRRRGRGRGRRRCS